MTTPQHPEKGPFLRELQAGERFVGYYVLRSKHLEPFRDASRGNYLTLILSDRSGQMVGRVWEDAESVDSEVVEGEVLKVDGEAELYQERLQARVLRVRVAKPDEYDLRDMLPSSRRDPQEMTATLQDHIEQVEEPHLRALVDAFFADPKFLQVFTQAPAARRIHHAYLHGLLEQTVEALALAHTVIEQYPQIDASLLLAGVLLHGIGKVREFSWGMDIDYSDEGRLLGHLVIADEMVADAIRRLPDFPPELALRVRHMLLAHHGRYEWGSPRRPMTLEAIALHHIENLAAQLNRFQTILQNKPEGQEWTAYDRMLGRQLYGGDESDDDLSIEERSRTD